MCFVHSSFCSVFEKETNKHGDGRGMGRKSCLMSPNYSNTNKSTRPTDSHSSCWLVFAVRHSPRVVQPSMAAMDNAVVIGIMDSDEVNDCLYIIAFTTHAMPHGVALGCTYCNVALLVKNDFEDKTLDCNPRHHLTLACLCD